MTIMGFSISIILGAFFIWASITVIREKEAVLIFPLSMAIGIVIVFCVFVNSIYLQNSDTSVVRIEVYRPEQLLIESSPFRMVIYMKNSDGIILNNSCLVVTDVKQYEVVKNNHFKIERKIHSNMFGFEFNDNWEIVDSNSK